MNKVRSNAAWTRLTAEQCKALDKWLFDENQSYREVWRKAQEQFKYEGSQSSMRHYYVRRRKERTLEEFKDLRDEVAAISGAPGDVATLRTASMKLLARFLFKRAQQSPDKVKEWAPVAQLLLQHDYNDVLRELKDKEEKLRRELKAEDHKIRREALEFAKTKFQFDVTEQAMKALPELQELAQARKDPDTKRYESNAFLNMARYKVAGVVSEVKPESAQEEAEMLAARKAREERKQRRLEWEQKEKITGHEPPTPSSPYYAEYLEWKAKRGKHDHGE